MDIESKNGVIQSSIALLQERFKQLQREKEMRQRKELLTNMIIMSSSSSSSSSSSDSESENHIYTTCTTNIAMTSNNESLKLLFADEVAIPSPPPMLPPHHHSHMVDLSLWPAGSHRDDNAILRNSREEKSKKNKSLYSYEWLSCDNSHAFDDVDTSLRL